MYDPFAPNQGNIFEQAAQQQQQNTGGGAMPAGMPQQPPQGQQQQNPADQPMGDSMTGGAQPQNSQTPTGGASPLDQWAPKPDNGQEGGAPAASPTEQQQPTSVFDSARDDFSKLAEAQDYVGDSLTPEVWQQIQNGDLSALSNLLNNVGRQAFTNAAFASSRIARTGVKQSLEHFQSGSLPKLLQDNNFQQAFAANDHAILKHPAVAPMVEFQTQQFRNQFPNANPKEIQQKVVDYFNTVGQQFASAASPNANTGVGGGQQPEKTGLELLIDDL